MYEQLEVMGQQDLILGGDAGNVNINLKVPKRVLHFSDGVLEEFSEDEVDSAPPKTEEALIDTTTLEWVPWFKYKAWAAGTSTLAVCDYIGEALAEFLGITTPKYHYELEEYKRIQAEKLKEDQEAKGWSEPVELSAMNPQTITTEQPQPVAV